MKFLLTGVFILVLIFNTYLFITPGKSGFANYFFNLAYSVIFILGAYIAFSKSKIMTYSRELAISLVSFSLSMVFFALGLVSWAYYNLVVAVEVPYPSISDLFFIIYYPAVAIGIYYLIIAVGGGFTKKLVLEGLLIFVVFFMILYLFLDQTNSSPDPSQITSLLSTGYILGDALLTSLAITILRTEKGTSLHPYLLYFVFGFLMLATGDTIFSFRSATGQYWNGDISDLLFAISGFVISLGFIFIPDKGDLLNKSAEETKRINTPTI
jgi:two-component system, sensor histidine kinase PdtaS